MRKNENCIARTIGTVSTLHPIRSCNYSHNSDWNLHRILYGSERYQLRRQHDHCSHGNRNTLRLFHRNPDRSRIRSNPPRRHLQCSRYRNLYGNRKRRSRDPRYHGREQRNRRHRFRRLHRRTRHHWTIGRSRSGTVPVHCNRPHQHNGYLFNTIPHGPLREQPNSRVRPPHFFLQLIEKSGV